VEECKDLQYSKDEVDPTSTTSEKRVIAPNFNLPDERQSRMSHS